jgi:hypothetical protein
MKNLLENGDQAVLSLQQIRSDYHAMPKWMFNTDGKNQRR